MFSTSSTKSSSPVRNYHRRRQVDLTNDRAMSLGARLLVLPAMRYACGGGMFGKRIPLTTQLVSAVGGRRALGGPQRFSPLSGATSSTHGVLQVRAASSKKKDKAGGKKKKTGAPRKSRYGPGGAPQTSGTTAPAKPLREDLDMSELRIDALLNELVDGSEGMSNRAKFRALPVDDKIMRTIKDVSISNPFPRSPARFVLRRSGFRLLTTHFSFTRSINCAWMPPRLDVRRANCEIRSWTRSSLGVMSSTAISQIVSASCSGCVATRRRQSLSPPQPRRTTFQMPTRISQRWRSRGVRTLVRVA